MNKICLNQSLSSFLQCWHCSLQNTCANSNKWYSVLSIFVPEPYHNQLPCNACTCNDFSQRRIIIPKYNLLLLKVDCNMVLTLTLPGPSAGVSGSLDSYCSLKPLCSGMGEVVPARTSPTLLPPSPRTVLSLSCFKVSQCINCRDWHCKS